jgi:DNA-binding transcriptional MocR family regulator
MHLFWTLPEWAPDPATLAARARELDVGIYTPQAVGVRTFGPPGEVDRALMLGYSALSAPEIVTGIQRVGQLLRSPSSNG